MISSSNKIYPFPHEVILAVIGKIRYLYKLNRAVNLPIDFRIWSIFLLQSLPAGMGFRLARHGIIVLRVRLMGRFLWARPGVFRPMPNRRHARNARPLLAVLREQKSMGLKGGIYHRTQIDLTYNSNHIEGSRLTHDQTRYIFETNTIGIEGENIKVDDIIETVNHFRCIDLIIDRAQEPLTESLIKDLHAILKSGTADSRKEWFAAGEYKRFPNEVGGNETTAPEDVKREIKALLKEYNVKKKKSFDDVLDLHQRFEAIHPFGNGRVGRLVMFKECLANGIVPFIITDELKMFYYRGLQQWPAIREYLRDTCLTAQDNYKALLDYYRIKY